MQDKAEGGDMNQSSEAANIMLVDDTPENLKVLGNMLRDQGFRLLSFPRGALALKAAKIKPPDLILLDINMPEMDGYEVCRKLKQDPTLSDVPVIFISALTETEDKIQAFRVGGVDYVTKPFQLEEVIARVHAHLTLRRLQGQLEERNVQLENSLARQKELENIKEQLVQMLVHDLKSPLSAILGNLSFLAAEVKGDQDVNEAIEDIDGAGRAMQRMLMNMLDVMRLDETGLQPRRTSVDLGRLLEEASRAGRSYARLTHQNVSIRVSDDISVMALDTDLVRRLFENLIDNALKYSPSDSTVSVDARLDGEDAVLIVFSDGGAGIPEDFRERIFLPYTRLERDKGAQARKSRGLGLSFCKLAAEAHGGSIWVEDNQPKGARFVVKLPRTPK